MQRGGVDEVELGTVGEHDADGVAVADAEGGESRGDAFDRFAYSPQVTVWMSPGVRNATFSGCRRAVSWKASGRVRMGFPLAWG